MESKCTKCGNTENYNFALNIGLCDICIGQRLEELDNIKQCRRCSAKTNISQGEIGCRAKELIKELEAALFQHRWDLHRGSDRPCPTCRQSAEVLKIKVPSACARKAWDKQALKKDK